MKYPRRYRLNRAEGRIYRQSIGGLTPLGREMNVALLYATDPTRAAPYPSATEQEWVALSFLDSERQFSYALLNSGSSNALAEWLAYRQQLRKEGLKLWQVTTRIGFRLSASGDGHRSWYYYTFTAEEGLPSSQLLERLRQQSWELVDPFLDLGDIPKPSVAESIEEIEATSLRLADERTQFLHWE